MQADLPLPLPMPEPGPPAIPRHQVLADPTGRRRRRLAIAGRVATTGLGLWLLVLILGGLGLQPVGGLPIVGDLGAGEAAPPALPEAVRTAVTRRTTVTPATGAAQAPATTVPSRRPSATAPSRVKTRPPARTTPATAPGRTKTTPGRGPASAAPAPSPAPSPSRPKTSPSTTAPGQTRTPPGQTKTGPGPPTSTPGATRRANGTVTTP